MIIFSQRIALPNYLCEFLSEEQALLKMEV